MKIGDLFDSFYEMSPPTPGLPFFELRWHATGFELWAGRRHLTIEVPPLARVIRGLAVRITDGIVRAQAASLAQSAERDAADLSEGATA
ncbi:hypothetical protein [Methylobacterium sp. WL9]|uniref:hypothetical protein n=1 Tax=Methylobacterium sp. WL9 TaxID=2603898 RepID=UPI0011C9FE8C|nr:hypothetical protein [Methylobacterium sp. WL9]TXN20784.1 hypothetical protein FV217_16780 [Methylobacterium sp. WL9]